MKRNSGFILTLAIIFIAGIGMKSIPGDNPQDKKKSTHIKLVTVKDGEKHELDTIILGNNMKILHLSKDKNFSWIGAKGDTLTEDIEMIKGDGKGNRIFVHRRGRGRGPIEIRETVTSGDSGKKVIVRVEKSAPGEGDIFIRRPGMGPQSRMVRAPKAAGTRMPYARAPRLRQLPGRNVIDLNDPGIISFEKKKLSGGREKITIIRNEVKQIEERTFDIGRNDEVNKELIKDLPNAEREIKIRKEELNPSEINKK